MNTRKIVLFIALAAAAWLAIFGDRTPDSALALPTRDATPALAEARSAHAGVVDRQRSSGATAAEPPVSILRVRERARYVPLKSDLEQESAIFGSNTWDPPAPKAVPAAPSPPQAPPLPFTYLGKKFEDGTWEVYLGLGDNTRVLRPNSTLDGQYAVGAIVPPNLKLTYLPLGQEQTMSIGNP
jgi:hypothetical protein